MLRWLQQHGITEIDATVRREQLVKLDHLRSCSACRRYPATCRRPSASLTVENLDLLAPEITCRFLSLLGESNPAEVVEEEEQ